MPELPEVETLRQELAKAVVGKTIRAVQISWPKLTRPLAPAEFNRRISGKKILNIDRRAKILILQLSGGLNLLIHLKLTGQLLYQPRRGPLIVGGHPADPTKYTRAVFTFTDGSRLYFNDLRKFAWLKLAAAEELNKILPAEAVEPLSQDFTLAKFSSILDRYPSRKIKQLLMDQELIAGLGNIYADEACFVAGTLPTRRAGDLTGAARKKLHQAIRTVLGLAIKHKGTSADRYLQLNGSPGGFLPYLKVYGREGEKCRRCGQLIKKIKLAGRGTHFCDNCQR